MSESASSVEHNRQITEQFTRQAIPFTQLHSDDDSVRRMMGAAEVTRDDRVLDVACGPGLVACAFARVAAHVTGIDLTPAMIEQARQIQQRAALTNLTWRVGDVTTLPFPDAAFSVVVSRYALHHLLTPARTIAEMARVCTPGGRVVIADVFTVSDEQAIAYDAMEKLRDPSHVRAMNLDELQKSFADSGLANVQTQFFRFGVHLDHLLKATCTPPERAEQLRQIVASDVGKNVLGIDAQRADGALGFSFPVALVAGRKL